MEFSCAGGEILSLPTRVAACLHRVRSYHTSQSLLEFWPFGRNIRRSISSSPKPRRDVFSCRVSTTCLLNFSALGFAPLSTRGGIFSGSVEEYSVLSVFLPLYCSTAVSSTTTWDLVRRDCCLRHSASTCVCLTTWCFSKYHRTGHAHNFYGEDSAGVHPNGSMLL